MAFTESNAAFHTVLFGETVNKSFDGADNDRLLAEQLAACREVIAAHYPTLGFV